MGANQPLQILIIDDEELVHETIGEYLRSQGHETSHAHSAAEGKQLLREREHDLTLLDIRLPGSDGLVLLPQLLDERPDLAVVIISGHGTLDMAITALRAGAADFLPKPIKLQELDAVLEKSKRIQALKRDRRRLRETIGFMQRFGPHRVMPVRLIGRSESTERVRRKIRLAVEARCDTILVTGETGTGKEVVSRELHFFRGGRDSPFIAVSCPAIPESLVESELFGHVKGAFTGAVDDRAGCFELADGGTLFLDEIGDLSPAAQAKLLRVLETRTVRRVGGGREHSVNVRVVAATNVPLEQLVEEKLFRADLLYRLNVFSIQIAPLRERRGDILPLAQHFLTTYCRERAIEPLRFTEEAESRLVAYDFPGNARELRNIVERSAILSDGDWIDAADLDLPSNPRRRTDSGVIPLIEHERSRIELTLERVRWNRREAARMLDMSYSTLRYKMRKYGIG